MKLLCAAGLALAPLAAHAGWDMTPWEHYVDACDKLPRELAALEKQVAEGSPVLFTSQVKISLERMKAGREHASPADKATVDKCDSRAAAAQDVMAAVAVHERAATESQRKAARVEHEASAEYKAARSLGYSDVGHLGSFGLLYQENGEAKLRRFMLLIDDSCGAYFRAVQQVGALTIYAPGHSRNHTCGGDERVAVAHAKGVQPQRGAFIDPAAYYVFDRVATATAADGFPTKIAVLRQVFPKKAKP